MSYDVYVGQSSENYTSNLYKFFQDFDAYPPSWHGINASEVGDAIDSTLNTITVNAVDSLAAIYDASNGWGSVATALEFLKRVRNACRDNPTDVVEVSW